MQTVIERLAGIAGSVRASALPPEVLRAAADRLLDGLGCMLAGSREPTVRTVHTALAAPHGPATLFGGTDRAGLADATLANTTALRYHDFMDGHPGPYPCHPSMTLPAVLAVAEAVGASGAEVLRAVALTYELDIRLQIGAGDPDITAHGWSGSTNVGLAVPFGIGGLFGLTADRLADAIAIATVHSPALDASGRGAMAPSKAVVDGMVAASAVTATLLARGGLGGKRAAFEGDDGYVAALARGWNEDVVLAPLDRFRILDVYTKLYNTVKCGQTAVSAALRLRDRLLDRWGDLGRIRSITVTLAERDRRNQLQDEEARRRPPNRDTANHSAVFCVAAALVAGDLQAAQFSPESLVDPRTLALVDRTTLGSDERYTAFWPGANPAGVRIELEDGTVLEDEELYSPGHPRNPLTAEQLRGKFRAQVEPVLGPDRTTDLIAAVDDVADLPDLTELIALCRPAAEMEMEFTA